MVCGYWYSKLANPPVVSCLHPKSPVLLGWIKSQLFLSLKLKPNYQVILAVLFYHSPSYFVNNKSIKMIYHIFFSDYRIDEITEN